MLTEIETTEEECNHNLLICQIVDRRHVGDSPLSIVRYVLSRMKKGAWKKTPKPDRREIIRHSIEHHIRCNRGLYNFVVMGGVR